MSGKQMLLGSVVSASALVATMVPQALADDASSGGVAVPAAASIQRLSCGDAQAATCQRGDALNVTGEGLADVGTVVFLGGRGVRDDRRATPVVNGSHSLTVTVPAAAASGPVRVVSRSGGASEPGPTLVIGGRAPAPSLPAADVKLPAGKAFLGGPPATFRYTVTGQPAPDARVELYRATDATVVRSWPLATEAGSTGVVRWDGRIAAKEYAPVGRYGFRLVGAGTTARAASADASGAEFDLLDHIFPIRGKHDLGQSDVNAFGGGRRHQGQDMFASCGTPIVAARGGIVTKAAFQGRAGNYVVVTDDTGQSTVYMHMRTVPLVVRRERVVTGQQVGEVGETGRASGCHLHFELRRWDELT